MAQTYTPNTVVVFHSGGCTKQVDVTGVFINKLFQVANERETCSSSVAMASFEEEWSLPYLTMTALLCEMKILSI